MDENNVGGVIDTAGASSNKSPGIRIREHAKISTGRHVCSRCDRGRSGGSIRCANSIPRRLVSTAQKFHGSFIGKLHIPLEEFRIFSVAYPRINVPGRVHDNKIDGDLKES
jgi:hypothetical protein